MFRISSATHTILAANGSPAAVGLPPSGDPPIMALNRMRIDKARSLLQSSRRPITDIALDCGFTSSQYFARTFKAYTGVTPRDYRSIRFAAPGGKP